MSSTNVITSLGAADIDTKELTTNLVAATKEPRQKLIDTEKKRAQVAISNTALLKNGLSALSAAAAEIASASKLNRSAVTSTNSSIVNAESLNSAVAKKGVYSVMVNRLSTPERQRISFERGYSSSEKSRIDLSSIPSAAPSAPKLVMEAGKTPSDIAKAINDWIKEYAPTSRASASLLDTKDGSAPLTIVVEGPTGAANSFDLKIDFAAVDEPVSDYNDDWTVDPAYQFYSIGTAGDAEFSVNGVLINRPSNQINDVIDGISLQLNAKALDTEVKITVKPDPTSIIENIKTFVETYNVVSDFLKKATGPKVEGDDVAGSLQNNSSARAILRSLRSAVTSQFTAAPTSIQYLNSLGVAFDRSGVLQFDESKLTSAYASNPADVVTALGNNTRGPYLGTTKIKSGLAGDIANIAYKMVTSTGELTAITKSYETLLSRAEKKQDALDAYVERLTAQYEGQFQSLNNALASFKNTQNQLAKAFNLNKSE